MPPERVEDPVAVLAVLQQDPLSLARLTSALGATHELVLCRDWKRLWYVVGHLPLDGCVLDVYRPSREAGLRQIERLRRRAPTLAIVAYADFTGREMDLFELGRLKVDAVLLAGDHESVRGIQEALSAALGISLAARVVSSLAGRLPSPGPDLLRWTIEHAHRNPRVGELAESFSYTTRSLSRILRGAGLPPPLSPPPLGPPLARRPAAGRPQAHRRAGGLQSWIFHRSGTVSRAPENNGCSAWPTAPEGRPSRRSRGVRACRDQRSGGTRRADGVEQEDRPHDRSLSLEQIVRVRRSPPRQSRARSALAAVFATGLLISPGLATAQLLSVIEAPPLDQAHWGILALDITNGQTLAEHQSAKKFIPASNQKLLTSAAALHLLGPDFRFETALLATGELDAGSGVLSGDLLLPGTGDPTLSRRFWGNDEAPLRALADSLRRAGLSEVSGSLVVDASLWDSAAVPGSWMVEDLGAPTGASGGAFAVAEGVTTVTIVGGSLPGEPAVVEWTPHGEDDFVIARVETVAVHDGVAPRVEVEYLPQSHRLVVQGAVFPGARRTLRVATRDPVRQSAAALARALAEAGIPVRGGWRVVWEAGEPLSRYCRSGDVLASCATRLAVLRSPPLTEVVRAVLEPSQNWIAEQLVRSLATAGLPEECCGPPEATADRAALEEGLDRVRSFLVDDVGVDSLDLSLRDGSGLSVQNLVTPRALVRLLDYAASSPWASAFRSALAEPGEKDSTLEARLQELEGRVFAKTGSLTHVTSLSGYLFRADGSTVIFSILSNGAASPSVLARDAIDRIVRILASAD